MILTVILFVVVVSAILAGVAIPVIKHLRISQQFLDSHQSFMLVESGNDDVRYQFQKGFSVIPPETLSLAGYTASTTVTDFTDGKLLTTTAIAREALRKVESRVSAGVGVAFYYGLQVGSGGIVFNNSAGVNGNVYSNGDISGATNAFISGTAIAASYALVSNQQNDIPSIPPDSVTFGNSQSTEDFAQSFQLSTTSPLNKIEVYIKKTGGPSNATVRIVRDVSGTPDDDHITTGTLSASQVTGSYGWVNVTFSNTPSLLASTTYWFVIDASTNASKYYTIAANSSYVFGVGKVGSYGGAFSDTSPAGLDGYFKIYVGGVNATISDVTVGLGSVGDAHAHTVEDSTIAGNLYCQTGSGNNKPCDTSRSDPPPQNFPISDGNIAFWKEQAEAGGVISGDYTPTGASSSLGPKKITGNFTLTDDHVLTLTGTVYVVGNITVENDAKVIVSSSYGGGSGVVVADGWIHVGNNGGLSGSGSPGSYVMFLSTLSCDGTTGANNCGHHDGAVDLHNGATGAIFYAGRGLIFFHNGAVAKQLTAQKIRLEESATVTYETGLINTIFTNGPSGGWNLIEWREIE